MWVGGGVAELEPQGPLKVNIAACIWAKSFSSGPGEAFLNARPSTTPPTPSFTNQHWLESYNPSLTD